MEEISKILNKQKSKEYSKHKFYNLTSLAIAFIIKQVDIKQINLKNFDDILDESEYSSFWKLIKKYCFEEFKISSEEINEIVNNGLTIQKYTAEDISDTLLEELNNDDSENDSKISAFLPQILNVTKGSKAADTFGQSGQTTFYLAKKCGSIVDYYDSDQLNILKTIIRLNIFGENCSIQDDLIGKNKKNKYDFIIANPKLDINNIFSSYKNNNEIISDLVDSENIEPFIPTKDISRFYILSIIIISMLKKDGKAGVILPTNCLTTNNDKYIRKYLVNSYLSEVINLPEHLYPLAKIILGDSRMSLLIFEKNKENDDIKFSNLEFCYVPKGENNEIDIDKALNAYKNDSKNVSRDAVRRNRYSLDSSIYLNDININNPVYLEEVTIDIFRGYQFKKDEINKMKTSSESDVNYRVFKINDNQFEDVTQINSKGKNFDRYLLKEGDIILNARGAENDVTILPKLVENLKLIATGSMIVIRSNDEKINSKYLEFFLKSKRGDFVLSKSKNKNAVYVGNLKKMKVSCPPLDLQNEMLAKIEVLEKAIIDIKNLM